MNCNPAGLKTRNIIRLTGAFYETLFNYDAPGLPVRIVWQRKWNVGIKFSISLDGFQTDLIEDWWFNIVGSVLFWDRQYSIFNPSDLAAHGMNCTPAGLKTRRIRRWTGAFYETLLNYDAPGLPVRLVRQREWNVGVRIANSLDGLQSDGIEYWWSKIGGILLSWDRQSSTFNPSGLAAHGMNCTPAGLKTRRVRRWTDDTLFNYDALGLPVRLVWQWNETLESGLQSHWMVCNPMGLNIDDSRSGELCCFGIVSLQHSIPAVLQLMEWFALRRDWRPGGSHGERVLAMKLLSNMMRRGCLYVSCVNGNETLEWILQIHCLVCKPMWLKIDDQGYGELSCFGIVRLQHSIPAVLQIMERFAIRRDWRPGGSDGEREVSMKHC